MSTGGAAITLLVPARDTHVACAAPPLVWTCFI
jgi:hypothetical protein